MEKKIKTKKPARKSTTDSPKKNTPRRKTMVLNNYVVHCAHCGGIDLFHDPKWESYNERGRPASRGYSCHKCRGMTWVDVKQKN
jgi:hypothetical protein